MLLMVGQPIFEEASVPPSTPVRSATTLRRLRVLGDLHFVDPVVFDLYVHFACGISNNVSPK